MIRRVYPQGNLYTFAEVSASSSFITKGMQALDQAQILLNKHIGETGTQTLQNVLNARRASLQDVLAGKLAPQKWLEAATGLPALFAAQFGYTDEVNSFSANAAQFFADMKKDLVDLGKTVDTKATSYLQWIVVGICGIAAIQLLGFLPKPRR